jgi:hypothetical protein
MMSKRVVPAVVVGKEEDGLVRTANNEGVHVRKFGPVGNLNGFETNVWRKRMEASCRRRHN